MEEGQANIAHTTYPSGFTNGTTTNSRLFSREVTCTKIKVITAAVQVGGVCYVRRKRTSALLEAAYSVTRWLVMYMQAAPLIHSPAGQKEANQLLISNTKISLSCLQYCLLQ